MKKNISIVSNYLNIYNKTIKPNRTIFLSFFLLILYFVSYFVIKTIFYILTNKYVGVYISEKYFIYFYFISTLPIFFLFLFKMNIISNFWKKLDKPYPFDYLYYIFIFIFIYFSFNQWDLTQTAMHGYTLLDMILNRINILSFYDVNQGAPAYLLPQYIIFAIWSIPVRIIQYIFNIPLYAVNDYSSIQGITLWWYKLLPTIFYFGSFYILYKISILLSFSNNKAKWISFIWFILPIAVFSLFAFGQYDSITVFFELIMIYYFLQKKLLKASLICLIPITFKMFPIFIFIPIILLFEKNIIKIFKYIFISFSGYLFFKLLFLNSSGYEGSLRFYNHMSNLLTFVGIQTHFGNISIFLLCFIVICIYSYFINIKNKDIFTIQKYILYIPLAVYSCLFSFILFHPFWLIILSPYLILNIFLNKNSKKLLILLIGINIAFFLITMSMNFWVANIDNTMLFYGILPKIFNLSFKQEFFTPTNFITTINGRLSTTYYITLLVSLLFLNLYYSFPNNRNIAYSRIAIKKNFNINRDIIWIYGLIILMFVIPNLLLFFRHGN